MEHCSRIKRKLKRIYSFSWGNVETVFAGGYTPFPAMFMYLPHFVKILGVIQK